MLKLHQQVLKIRIVGDSLQAVRLSGVTLASVSGSNDQTTPQVLVSGLSPVSQQAHRLQTNKQLVNILQVTNKQTVIIMWSQIFSQR